MKPKERPASGTIFETSGVSREPRPLDLETVRPSIEIGRIETGHMGFRPVRTPHEVLVPPHSSDPTSQRYETRSLNPSALALCGSEVRQLWLEKKYFLAISSGILWSVSALTYGTVRGVAGIGKHLFLGFKDVTYLVSPRGTIWGILKSLSRPFEEIANVVDGMRGNTTKSHYGF